jgi:hypothetical protein
MSRRSHVALAALVLGGLLLSRAWSAEEKSSEIFNGKDLTGWKIFVDPKSKDKAKPEEVWSVEKGIIQCKGRPNGYIITEKEYGDYVLELEWRWPKTKGNSGVLLHVSGKDKIWPKSFEAQLFAGSAGDIWLIDGYKLDVDKERQDPRVARHYFRMHRDKPVEKEIGEWNKYRITCKGDSVKLEVNGTLVNEGKNGELTKGKIALQSEGAPIEFRNIKLTPIK